MTTTAAIIRRELESYFSSPIGYVVLAFFLFLYGFVFYSELAFFLAPDRLAPGDTANVNESMIPLVFHSTAFIAVLVLPLVTMRSFAEELRSGTIELLFTSPITDTQLVLGKFFGALSLYVIMLVATLPLTGLLFYFGDPDLMPVVVGYLGMFLLGASYVAFGLLFSSVTKNQVIAGFLTVGAFLFLYMIELATAWGGLVADLVPFFSVSRHFEEFAKGVVDTRDIAFYLSFIALGLFLARQSIASYRWRT